MPAVKSKRLANRAKKYIASIGCMPYTPSLEGLPTWMSNFALEVTADLKDENTRLASKLARARESFQEIIRWEEQMETKDSAVCKIARKWLEENPKIT